MLRVKGWQKFQHYKKRNPPWIRLYRDLLEKKEWHRLSYASRSLAIAVWLIASENEDIGSGLVTSDYEELAFRARMKDTDVVEAIKELIKQGFIEHLEPDQADLLAPCYQHATPDQRSDQRSESDQIRKLDPVVPVDNGDKSGSLKNGSLSRSEQGKGSAGGYDVRDEFTDADWENIAVTLNGTLHTSWDRKVVFEKFNNLVKNDPPKKPVPAFKAWLDKNRRWLSRAP